MRLQIQRGGGEQPRRKPSPPAGKSATCTWLGDTHSQLYPRHPCPGHLDLCPVPRALPIVLSVRVMPVPWPGGIAGGTGMGARWLGTSPTPFPQR